MSLCEFYNTLLESVIIRVKVNDYFDKGNNIVFYDLVNRLYK